jgi:hypothetical protein
MQNASIFTSIAVAHVLLQPLSTVPRPSVARLRCRQHLHLGSCRGRKDVFRVFVEVCGGVEVWRCGGVWMCVEVCEGV